MSTTISYLIVSFKNWILEINKNKKNLPFYLFGVLFGFLFGNLFGIVTKFFSGTILQISVTIFLELLTFFQYLRFNRQFTETKSIKILKKNSGLIILNLFKQGFLIGIFLEAFKVGS